MENKRFENNGGGATLLSRQDKGFDGTGCVKLLRYYGTKALRRNICNINVGRLYQADRKINSRIINSAPQDTKRIDTTPETNYNSNMMNYNLEMLKRVQDDTKPHLTHFTHAKRAAFTLAEVLITLAVIGIVAAMTIPTLISNYQEKQTISKLQKVYATLKNAFEMGKVQHGDYETWSWNQIPNENAERISYFWETYVFPHLKVTKKCFPVSNECVEPMYLLSGSSLSNTSSTRAAFILEDGTSVYTWASSGDFFPHIFVFADINGKAKPNIVGKDIFVMYFSPQNPGNKLGSLDDDGNFVDSGKLMTNAYGLSFYGDMDGVTVEDLMDSNFIVQNVEGTNNKMGCSSGSLGYACGAAIKLNGWKFPDGYPD